MKVMAELVSTIIRGAVVSDLQHIDCQFLLDSFSIQIHSEIDNRVSNVETMMKLSLVAVTLGDCNISAYRQESEEI